MPTPRRHAHHAARQAAYRERCAAVRRSELEAKGLPALPAIPSIPGHARWRALTRQAQVLLETLQQEMQTYYEQRSEAWQESETGEALLERLQALQEVRTAMEELPS